MIEFYVLCTDCGHRIFVNVAEYLEELDNGEFEVQQNPDKVSPLRLKSIEEGYDAIFMRAFVSNYFISFWFVSHSLCQNVQCGRACISLPHGSNATTGPATLAAR